MADCRHGSCQCQHEPQTIDGLFNRNHCHYEHVREESRGPLTRTTTSRTRDCHLHNSAPCPGSHQFNGHNGGRSSRRHCNRPQDPNRDMVELLQELIGSRQIDSGTRRLFDDLARNQDHRDSDNRQVLIDTIVQLLDQQENGRPSPRITTNFNGDVEVDVFLNIDGNSSNNTNISIPRCTGSGPRYMSRRDRLNGLINGSPNDNYVAIPMSMLSSGGLDGRTYGPRIRELPGWISGVWH